MGCSRRCFREKGWCECECIMSEYKNNWWEDSKIAPENPGLLRWQHLSAHKIRIAESAYLFLHIQLQVCTGFHHDNKEIARTYIPNNTLIRKALADKPDVQEVEKWAQWWTSYSNAGSWHLLINVVKMWWILWWERKSTWNAWYSMFVVKNDGSVVWQGGEGRFFDEPFSEVRKKHRSRVRGNE